MTTTKVQPPRKLTENEDNDRLMTFGSRSSVIIVKMRQGTSVKFAEAKKPIPPRFGFDTESSFSDEEDPPCITITQFSNWCARQSTFVPKPSIFLHWF